MENKFKKIQGETAKQRWKRELYVILHNKFLDIPNDENCTFALWKFWSLIKDSNFSVWINNTEEDFILSDIALTSETDILHQKELFLYNITSLKLSKLNEKVIKNDILKLTNFHENFFMFPVTTKIMVVMINPFFKQLINGSYLTGHEFDNFFPNTGVRKELYYPNSNYYINNDMIEKLYNLDKQELIEQYLTNNDIFIYSKKTLKKSEVIYLNSLMLDRVEEYFGFNEIENIKESVKKYNKISGKRNNYDKFLKLYYEKA